MTKIAELERVVKHQAARIADLGRRLNKNSSNSSKPPFTLYLQGVASDLIRRIYEHKARKRGYIAIIMLKKITVLH